MKQITSSAGLTFTFPDGSYLSESEPCPGCEKYGAVRNCEEQDLRHAMYFNLAGSLFRPDQTKLYSSCTTPTEKQLLWHAHLLARNPTFIFQLIKNLITYANQYICEEYADDIEAVLKNRDVHVVRELVFLCNVIEDLKKDKDPIMSALVNNYRGLYPSGVSAIFMHNIKYARVLPLLSLIFLQKTTDGKGFCIRNLGPPDLLSRSNSIIVTDSQSSSPPSVPTDTTETTFEESSQSMTSSFTTDHSENSVDIIINPILPNSQNFDHDFPVSKCEDTIIQYRTSLAEQIRNAGGLSSQCSFEEY